MYEHPSPLISQIFLRFSSGLRNRVLLAGLLSLLGGSVGAERHYVGGRRAGPILLDQAAWRLVLGEDAGVDLGVLTLGGPSRAQNGHAIMLGLMGFK